MIKITFTKREILNLIHSASQMETEYFDFVRSIYGKRKATIDFNAYQSGMDKLRKALKK